MIFRYLLLLHIIILNLSCENTPNDPTEKQPNVILILADDQGWGDLSLHGNPYVSTPHIDQIAKDGMQLTNFYVQPVCSPTRAEILTGRYHARGGVYATSAGGERLDIDEHTIAQVYQSNGYHTAAFGKWHNGSQHPYHPNSRGFDHFYGFTSGHWGHYFNPMMEENGEITKGSGFITDDLTDKAINYIHEHKEEPFFVYVPYNVPHSPMQVPEGYWSKHENQYIDTLPKEDIIHTKAALAMVENMDDNVGRITQTIEDLGLDEETIIIYMTDNGPNGQRWNGGLRGVKGSTDEGGVKSPFFIKWKDHITAGSINATIAGAIDILPTLIELCGLSKHQLPNQIDGQSLATIILGKTYDLTDRVLFQHWRDRVSVRTQKYRLDHDNRLYDIENDDGQKKNIQESHPQVYVDLMTQKKDWEESVLSQLNKEEKRPITIGHSQKYLDHLPARDATISGNLIRSNRYPNDSHFTNWVSSDDSINWEVDVLASGTYDVTLYYTCELQDIGSTIRLSSKNNYLDHIIQKHYSTALIGTKEDKVVRQESYVQDFQPVSLGSIALSKGLQRLSLHAPSIVGNEAAQFRMLLFSRD